MPSEPGSGSTRGNASSPSGDADADEKAAKLRERVRERLKARQAFALSGGPGTAAGDVTTVKRDRETLFTGDPCLDSDAKRRKTDTTTTSGGQTGNTTIHSNQPDSDQLTDPETNARRSRVEAWRAGRKGKMLLGADTDKDENGVDASGWNLEDESDDEAPATASGPADDDEEEDPLDAFMATNDGVMDFERESAAARQVEKETQATQKKLEKDRVEKELETAAQFAAAAARAARAAAATSSAAGTDTVGIDPDSKTKTNPSLGIDPAPMDTPDDDDIDPLDLFMAQNNAKADKMVADAAAKEAELGNKSASQKPGAVAALAGGVVLKPVGGFFKHSLVRKNALTLGTRKQGLGAPVVRRFRDDESDADESDDDSDDDKNSSDNDASDSDAEWSAKQHGKLSKAEKLGITDHTTVEYPPFRKNFYIESFEIARMSSEDVAALRTELDGIRCRGNNPPRPVKTWAQCGLSNRVSELIRRSGFEKPSPIQCQALPVIMSGRDCVGVAKTGSGKTLAYILPMLRHCKDQDPLRSGDGPLALLIGPTRELVTQIGKDCKKFGRAAGLVAVSVYGGAGVAAQIGSLKRGCEIVVCTPGRMIDVLTTSGGRVTNLRRVTYLVLDEADRMFDMGFEPQITRITNNLRPDRQTVMFSATFPKTMEALARAALRDPVEIQIGGRSVVNSDIEQIVEMRDEQDRFLRLLELLGEWYERGKSIVFVSSQEKCDKIFRDLLRSGYPCLSLHGGKEQSDRECTVNDFKTDVCNILVATSVAARGLDVKDLRLVINYDTPNHLEDYVHRVGRTGRAGAKGTAVTFISEEEERFAPDLCKAMLDAKKTVPSDLKEMADRYNAKRKLGGGVKTQNRNGGFGGTGFAFSKEEMDNDTRAKKANARAGGIEMEDDSDGDDDDVDDKKVFDDDGEPIFASSGRGGSAAAKAAEEKRKATGVSGGVGDAGVGPGSTSVPKSTGTSNSKGTGTGNSKNVADAEAGPAIANQAPVSTTAPPSTSLAVAGATGGSGGGALTLGGATTGAARAAAFAAALAAQHAAGTGRGGSSGSAPSAFESELEINDFPQKARWNVTHKDSLAQISEFTGAVITTRGQYLPPGKPLPVGERKLYLLIEGPTQRSVSGAKQKIKQIIEDAIAKETLPGGFGGGKYKV